MAKRSSANTTSGESVAPNHASGAVPLGSLGNLENMEEQMIIRALEQTGGHRAQAAEQLGISRRTLSRKLRESTRLTLCRMEPRP